MREGSSTYSKATNADTKAQPEYLTVRAACEFLMVGKNTIMEALRDIPGVVRLSERGIRIPRAGLIAWTNQMRIVR